MFRLYFFSVSLNQLCNFSCFWEKNFLFVGCHLSEKVAESGRAEEEIERREK